MSLLIEIESKFTKCKSTRTLLLDNMEIRLRSPIWNQFNRPDISPIVEHLSIANNNLKSLPQETLSLVNLKRLDISHCEMHDLNDISTLEKLEEIDMSYNDFEDESIEALPPNLFNVNANFNHFFNIPKVFFRESFIDSLKYLDLSNNRLTNLDGIGQLTALIELRANNNHLRLVPEEIKKLVNLKRLELKNNFISRYTLVEEGLDEQNKLTVKILEFNSDYDALPTDATVMAAFSPAPSVSEGKTPLLYPESNRFSLNLKTALNSPTSTADISIFSPTARTPQTSSLFVDVSFPGKDSPFSPMKSTRKLIPSLPSDLFSLPELEVIELKGNPLKHKELVEISSAEKFVTKRISLKQKLLGVDKRNHKIFGLA